MQKIHKIKFSQSPKCEDCNKAALVLHHKDFSKTKHTIYNLVCLCQACHMKRHKKHGDIAGSKPKLFYKKHTLLDWSKQMGIPYATLYGRFQRSGSIESLKSKFEKIYASTLQEIGDKLKISRERVRQLHYEGKLRKRLAKSQISWYTIF